MIWGITFGSHFFHYNEPAISFQFRFCIAVNLIKLKNINMLPN